MKYFSLLIISLVLSLTCFAQSSTDRAIDLKRKALKQEGVDTTVCYYVYCNGGIIRPVTEGDTACYAADIKYLIWKNGSGSFIQRFDNCKPHQPISIPVSFMNFVRSNYKNLMQEKILPPQYTYFEKGKKVTVVGNIDHACYTHFEIYNGNSTTSKVINTYYLESKYMDGGKHKNINFDHNQRSLQNSMKKQIEALLRHIPAYDRERYF